MAKIIKPVWNFKPKPPKKDLIYFKRMRFYDGTVETKLHIHPYVCWGALLTIFGLIIIFI